MQRGNIRIVGGEGGDDYSSPSPSPSPSLSTDSEDGQLQLQTILFSSLKDPLRSLQIFNGFIDENLQASSDPVLYLLLFLCLAVLFQPCLRLVHLSTTSLSSLISRFHRSPRHFDDRED